MFIEAMMRLSDIFPRFAGKFKIQNSKFKIRSKQFISAAEHLRF